MAEKIVFKKYIYKNRCDVAGCTNMAVKSVGIEGMTPGLLWNMCDECIKAITDEAITQGIISDDLKKKLALAEAYSTIEKEKDNSTVNLSPMDEVLEAKPKVMDAIELLNLLNVTHLKDIARGFKVMNVHTMTKEQLISEILDRALNK